MAEFTVLTPFPHTRTYDDLYKQGRIFDHDFTNYNAGKVVFQPKHMTPEKLQDLFKYAWDSFYDKESQEFKMFKLILSVIEKEVQDGTFRSRKKELVNQTFGKKIER